ncbi:DUF2256 domain-containing protein [Brevundimonas sp. DC300-4]|uniref:DUF2256 domain-containing protein n=1 Tax=unclassified Brevundimonas TaxID=2622653 RepID=UPI003CF24FA8
MARKHVNRGVAPDKRDLPQKTCVSCGKPFAWRAKWARDWEHVKFCSERCRRVRVSGAPAAPGS